MRINQRRRVERIRYVCSRLNRTRRRLRSKVDLLCRDLVAVNRNLAGDARRLSRAFDLFNSLTGRPDLHNILQGSMEEITKEAAAFAGAIYLCSGERFQTHTNWELHHSQAAWVHIENVLQKTIVRQVRQSGRSVLVIDGCRWRAVPSDFRGQLSGLSLMGLPIKARGNLLGVAVLCRLAANRFSQQDAASISPLLTPLGLALGVMRDN